MTMLIMMRMMRTMLIMMKMMSLHATRSVVSSTFPRTSTANAFSSILKGLPVHHLISNNTMRHISDETTPHSGINITIPKHAEGALLKIFSLPYPDIWPPSFGDLPLPQPETFPPYPMILPGSCFSNIFPDPDVFQTTLL